MFSLRGDSLPKIPVTPHEGLMGLPAGLRGCSRERPVTGLRAVLETVPLLQTEEGKGLGVVCGSKVAAKSWSREFEGSGRHRSGGGLATSRESACPAVGPEAQGCDGGTPAARGKGCSESSVLKGMRPDR